MTYLFDIFTRHEKLQTKALETLLEYSLYCKDNFSPEVVSAIHNFLTQHYAALSLAHAKILMESLSMVITAVDRANFATNMR